MLTRSLRACQQIHRRCNPRCLHTWPAPCGEDYRQLTVTSASLLEGAETHTAPNIALAAIKYADLSNGLQKDYVSDAERMVQTTGDTGPYLQYAHARGLDLLGIDAPDRM